MVMFALTLRIRSSWLRTFSRIAATPAKSDASVTHSSVSSGRTLPRTSLTTTWNSSVVLALLGVGGAEGERVAGLGATQVGIDLGDDGLGTDLVEVVLSCEAIERLTVLGAGNVDQHLVAVLGGPFGGLELGVLLAQRVDPLGDVVVDRPRAGAR